MKFTVVMLAVDSTTDAVVEHVEADDVRPAYLAALRQLYDGSEPDPATHSYDEKEAARERPLLCIFAGHLPDLSFGAPLPAPPRIAVILEGGLVQGIVTNDPAAAGQDVLVIDYDTEGTSMETVLVDQSDGSQQEACVWTESVEQTEWVNLAAVEAAMKARDEREAKPTSEMNDAELAAHFSEGQANA